MSDLDARCSCGHTANYHLTDAMQAARIASSGGRYPGECKGAEWGIGIPHCRCITSREQVIASAKARADA